MEIFTLGEEEEGALLGGEGEDVLLGGEGEDTLIGSFVVERERDVDGEIICTSSLRLGTGVGERGVGGGGWGGGVMWCTEGVPA